MTRQYIEIRNWIPFKLSGEYSLFYFINEYLIQWYRFVIIWWDDKGQFIGMLKGHSQ